MSKAHRSDDSGDWRGIDVGNSPPTHWLAQSIKAFFDGLRGLTPSIEKLFDG